MRSLKTKGSLIISSLLVLITIGLVGFVPFGLQAQPLSSEQTEQMDEQADAFRQGAGFAEETSVGGVIATGIKAVLGFLAIVFIIIMIINGFKWMTAGGNEDKVKEAKQAIRNAIIGLIIVIAAYSITYFVFDVLSDVGGGSGTTGSGGF